MLSPQNKKLIAESRFCIAGAGKSGIAVAELLSRHTRSIFVTDANPVSREIEAKLAALGVPFFTSDQCLPHYDCLVLSPAILLTSKPAITALRNNVSVVSEIEVAGWFRSPHHQLIGITGSNGKSTTTHYLTQLLAAANTKSVSCGNYGLPLSQIIEDPAYDTLVTELSSYQLETTFCFDCQIAIFLNIQPDHLARYQTMDSYFTAKWRLVLQTNHNGLVILGQDVLHHAKNLGLQMPTCEICILGNTASSQSFMSALRQLPCSLPVANYGGLDQVPRPDNDKSLSTATWTPDEGRRGGRALIQLQSKSLEIQIENPCLPGMHNVENILAASVAALFLNDRAAVKMQDFWELKTSTYQHIPHRLEHIVTAQITDQSRSVTVTFVNDSKATNVQSTLVALAAYSSDRVLLLLGGEPKGDCYGDLLPLLKQGRITVFPFGPAAMLIGSQLPKEYLSLANQKLLGAAECALASVDANCVILLSPGCASFDEFKNFEHRGGTFKEWALSKVTK